ncbi:hypothetical protein QE152_g6320 [Popillia japonica]|uniref:TRAFD1/XAF1 zinc finger domain-containing protein n=1 Tax=Popillia japonica TaxID=7064 RepID=A0AAW1MFV6_POPJA
MEQEDEMEICGNCKKEIPQKNYVMHTAHCARNITLCPACKEPIPKNKFEEHKRRCNPTSIRSLPEKIDFPKHISKPSNRPLPVKDTIKHVSSSLSATSISQNAQQSSLRTNQNHSKPFALKDPPASKPQARKDKNETTRRSSTEANASYVPPKPTTSNGLLPCKYCDLELPKLQLEDHENYCGARTDKCNVCGEIVMFKYKKLHEDSNHGFMKLDDEPGPRPSWDSSTERQPEPSYYRRQRPEPIYTVNSFDFSPLYNSYSATSVTASENDKRETYKDISRRLDCPAPQPPRRRPNPPSELLIPCEFCNVPIPHEDLIQHETGCRPDLARLNPRRRSPSPDDYFMAPEPSSPEVELPCEFCADMIPASQLLRHQLTSVFESLPRLNACRILLTHPPSFVLSSHRCCLSLEAPPSFVLSSHRCCLSLEAKLNKWSFKHISEKWLHVKKSS